MTEDFLDTCSDVSGENMTSLLSKWFSQSGYPVLAVDIIDNEIRYSQKPFALHLNPHDDQQYVLQVLQI